MENNNNDMANVLYNIYEPHIDYKNNRLYLKKYYDSLKNKYKVEKEVCNGDYIRYINLNNVPDITLHKGGIVLNTSPERIHLSLKHYHWSISKKDYVIFKKLTKQELVRIHLESLLT